MAYQQSREPAQTIPAPCQNGQERTALSNTAGVIAINGGGQNQARAILTGALVGAMVGVQGIPERFITGLDRSNERLQLARRIATQAQG